VFVRKSHENDEVARYKARLVAQGFSQRPEIDFDETYSHVVNAIIFRYLISLIAQDGLNLHSWMLLQPTCMAHLIVTLT
jgi:hypothetical protein